MKFHLVMVFVLTFFFPSLAHAAPKANASIINSQGKKIGQADFKENKEGLEMSIKVSGLTPGVHGMHIHAIGKCAAPDFKSAGGHFNPDGKQHGKENPEGFHAGDLPNLVIAGNGKGKINVLLPGLSLKGKNGILKPGKTALVIHGGPDDGKTDPAGNSGDRIACGVIG